MATPSAVSYTPVTLTPAAGLPVKVVEGGTLKSMRLMVVNSSGQLESPKAVRAIRQSYTSVTNMLSKPEFFCAQAGGSRDYPEMSMYAYTQSALLGFGALEFSCQRTSDGVWFGSYDLYLDRVSLGTATTTLNSSTMTWAQVQSREVRGSSAVNNSSQPNRPYARLIDVVDTYVKHPFIVGAKDATAHTAELLDLLDAHGGPSRFIMESPGVGNDTFLSLCTARGYKTIGIFQVSSIPVAAEVNKWDLVGMNSDSTQPQVDQMKALITGGKRLIAYDVTTGAGITSSRAKGFGAFLCRGVVSSYTLL